MFHDRITLGAQKAANGFIIFEGGPQEGLHGDQYVARFKTELKDILMQRAEAQINEIVERLTK